MEPNNNIVWIEEIGIVEPDLLPTIQTLQNVGDVAYIPEWPLFIIKVSNGMKGSSTQYYLQYNPESKKDRALIVFPSRQQDKLDQIIKALNYITELPDIRQLSRDGYLEVLYNIQEDKRAIYQEYGLQW